MSSTEKSFEEISKEIVCDFLQTVVVVDDKAYENAGRNDSKPATLNKAKGRQSSTNNIESLIILPEQAITDNQEQTKKDEQSEDDRAHQLDGEQLIALFAEKSLICAVLKPREGDDVKEIITKIFKVVKNSDLIVLDWQIYEHKNGEVAIGIIKKIIDLNNQSNNQLRLIAIYTGENNIGDIASDIKDAIKGECVDGNNFSIKKNFTQIVVYAKPETKVREGLQDRVIGYKELPDILITEFSKMTSGLVSNVVIKSLSILRANTYQLLAKFHRDIDIPFLAHRVLLTIPDESSDHLINIITSEFEVLLDINDAGYFARFENIERWVNKKIDDNKEHKVRSITLNKLQIKHLLKTGLNGKIDSEIINANIKVQLDGIAKKTPGELTQLLCDEQNFDHLNAEFAILTSLKKHNTINNEGENFKPKLTLGTIVEKKDNSDSTYWLCIQPRCDSTRLSDDRFFPLLSLELSDKDKKFDVVLINNGTQIHLKVNYKAYKLEMISFKHDAESKVILAQLETDKYYFPTSIQSVKYWWVADLKRDHAQRIAHQFASEISRVGLNESEWLRRSSMRSS